MEQIATTTTELSPASTTTTTTNTTTTTTTTEMARYDIDGDGDFDAASIEGEIVALPAPPADTTVPAEPQSPWWGFATGVIPAVLGAAAALGVARISSRKSDEKPNSRARATTRRPKGPAERS